MKDSATSGGAVTAITYEPDGSAHPGCASIACSANTVFHATLRLDVGNLRSVWKPAEALRMVWNSKGYCVGGIWEARSFARNCWRRWLNSGDLSITELRSGSRPRKNPIA